MTAQSVGKLEFESPISLDRSSGTTLIAEKTRSIMELFFEQDATGFIEWDVPDLDMSETIGLWFEISVAGKRTLVDYDGVFELPPKALELLERHGVDCAEMRKSLAD